MMPRRNLIALLVLLTVVGGVSLNAGFSWGWDTRNEAGACVTTAAEREARVRRVDAALRGFVEDDRR
jgi:hypothetical protein